MEELGDYDGIKKEPIYMAVKGRVFDVSTGTDFYGPEGGAYFRFFPYFLLIFLDFPFNFPEFP